MNPSPFRRACARLALGLMVAAAPTLASAVTTVGPAPVNPSPTEAPTLRTGMLEKIAANGRSVTIDGTDYALAAHVRIANVREATLEALKPGMHVQFAVSGNEVTGISVISGP